MDTLGPSYQVPRIRKKFVNKFAKIKTEWFFYFIILLISNCFIINFFPFPGNFAGMLISLKVVKLYKPPKSLPRPTGLVKVFLTPFPRSIRPSKNHPQSACFFQEKKLKMSSAAPSTRMSGSQAAALEQSLSLPLRPSAGVAGKGIRLVSNYFQVPSARA